MKLKTNDKILQPVLNAIEDFAELYPIAQTLSVQTQWCSETESEIRWSRSENKIFVCAATKNGMLAGLGKALQAKVGQEQTMQSRLTRLEAMVDVSRNAVYTLPTIKRFLCQLALMGYTGCQLYMEDTYELPNYPYFGYRRGKYSTQELKELDDFAFELGLELVPCIQTLAHLRTALRWQYTQPMKDTPDNLMVGEPETAKLVEAMLVHFAKTFRTRRIHIGMDEAVSLGMGRYRLKNGYKDHRKLTMEHLKLVCELCKKYGLQPMMWDDMLFRDHTPMMNYYGDSEPITPQQRAEYPENLSFVYWDYYHDSKEEYLQQIKRRGCLKTIFAGGVWKWGGWTPNLTKSFRDSQAAIEACAELGVKEIIVTLWGDDGAEAPLDCVLPGLALFGLNRFETAQKQDTDSFCHLLADCSLEVFEGMEKLDLIPGMPKENLEGLVPHKLLLYGDFASELFMPSLADNPTQLKEHFEQLEKEYHNQYSKTNCIHTQRMLELYTGLAKVLALRCEAAQKLHQSWIQNDKQGLKNVQNLLKKLSDAVAVFHNNAIILWSCNCKGEGMEIIDLRLGGLQGRCAALSRRIEMYLTGTIETLSELDEPCLPYHGAMAKDGLTPGRESYGEIVTANSLCHMFYI